jgi:hypothetical protein
MKLTRSEKQTLRNIPYYYGSVIDMSDISDKKRKTLMSLQKKKLIRVHQRFEYGKRHYAPTKRATKYLEDLTDQRRRFLL